MAATVNTVALLAAAPFPSHGGHGAASGAATGFPVLASVGLYVLVLVVGTLAAPALCGMRASGRLRTAVVAMLSLGYAGLVVAQLVRHQISGAVAAGVLTALVVAFVALRRGHRIEQAVAAGVLLVAQVPVVGTDAGISHLTGVLLHLAAASLWIGSVLHVVIVLADEGRTTAATAARRLSVLAVLSTVFLVGSGALLMAVHHVGRAALTGSTYGHVLLAKMGALLAAVTLGLAMRRRATTTSVRTWSRLVRGEAVVLAGGLALGAVLVGLAEPQPAYASTAPGLVHVRMGDESATLFVVRRDARTGWLLYAAGDEDAPQVRITDGAALQWTPSNEGAEIRPIGLRGGAARLTVRYENYTVHVTATPATGAPAALPAEDAVAAALGRSLGTV